MSDVTSLQNKHCNVSMLCVCIITYQLVIGMKISSSFSRNDAVSCSHRFSRGLRRIHPDFGAFIIDDLVTYFFYSAGSYKLCYSPRLVQGWRKPSKHVYRLRVAIL